MDWKIILVVVVGLLVFGIFQLCSEDEVDYDKLQAQQAAARSEEHNSKRAQEAQERRTKAQEEARAKRGERPEEATAKLETDDFLAVITTKGGALRSLTMKNPQYLQPPRDWTTGMRNEDAEDYVPVDLVTTNPDVFELNNPLRFEVYQGLDDLLKDADFAIVSQSKSKAVLRYDQPDLPVVITKKFEIDPNSGPFQLWLTVRVHNRSDRKVAFLAGVSQQGYQHQSEAEGGMFSKQPNIQQAICHHGEQNEFFSWDELADPERGAYSGIGVDFVGVQTNYFLAAMVPGDDAPTTCNLYNAPNRVVRADLRWGETELAPGASKVFKVKNYLGPKRYQLLERIGHHLEKSVDFGWFWPISRVLLWILFFFQKLVVNWGVAIILLTVVVKLALMPLTHKSFKSADRMKALKPEVDKINEQYKDDPQTKQKETMALYKRNKVNPLGGCLPTLLQMPIWFALFRTLRASPELYRAEFFGWIQDLSSPDPYYITPVVMGGMMFLQQRFTPMAGDSAHSVRSIQLPSSCFINL